MQPIGPNYHTKMEQVDAIFPQLDHVEIRCLSTSLKNEYDRWCQIIEEGTDPSTEDYEYQLIKLDVLIKSLDESIKTNVGPISFGQKQTELLIEAIDNEYEKNSDDESRAIVEQTREKIRSAAIKAYGEIILEIAHFKS